MRLCLNRAYCCDDGDVPAIELAELGVGFLNNFLAARDVQEAGDFLIHIPFPQCAWQRDDMLSRVIGDEEACRSLQFLGRFRNVAQFKVSNFSR